MPVSSQFRRPHGSLIGRAEETRSIGAALERDRLVSLLGPGGVGKTALAAEVAQESEPEYERVILVELIDVDQPSDVVRQLSLAAMDHATSSLAEVSAALDGAETLLVVDNCEHLIDQVAEVVGSCWSRPSISGSWPPRGARSTSPRRSSSRSLPSPFQRRTSDVENLLAFPSVALFLERVRHAVPSYELTAANSDDVAGICVASDGVPLVIELAAALVRNRPLAEILDAMTQSPNGIASRRRDLPEHQRTVGASLEWSRRFLDQADARLLDRLSVFAGGFTTAAARAIDLDGTGLGLDRLVDHSLVAFDPASGRYRLLEVVRLDAQRRLSAPERSDAERRHLGWCLEVVNDIAKRQTEPDPEDRFPLAIDELPNLESAAQRAYRSHELAQFWAIVGPIAVWWVHYAPPEDPNLWASICDAENAHAGVDPVWQANITSALAFYWSHRGDHRQAIALAQQAVRRHREIGDENGALLASMAAGNGYAAIDDEAAALTIYTDVLARSIDAGALYPLLYVRVVLARMEADPKAARDHLMAALEIAGTGYGTIEALANAELALLALRKGDVRLARRHVETGVAKARSYGYAEALANALCVDAEVAVAERDLVRARDSFSEARAIARSNFHAGLIDRADRGLAALDTDEAEPPATKTAEPLSERELSVARLLRGDLTQREIADELYIAPSTVKTHTKAIYRKLGVSKRSHAITRAMELGLFD